MPALPQLYPYKAGPIEPIVMPGEIVGIWVYKSWKFYKVDYIEPLSRSDPIEIDMGALAAAGVSSVTQLTDLEMPEGEFGQFRCAAVDDASFVLYQGRADQRHKLMNRVATYTRFTTIHDPCGHTTEFFVYENQWAFMQAQNLTDYALTQTRVAFWGNRYVCTKMESYTADKQPASWTRVPATAHL